jgi:hypothetical protein
MQIGPWQATNQVRSGIYFRRDLFAIIVADENVAGGMGPFFIKNKAGIAVNPFWPSQAGALLLTTV